MTRSRFLEEAANLVLKIALDLDQQCPACQKRPKRVAIESFGTHRLEPPVCMMRAMPAASMRLLLLICILSTALAWCARCRSPAGKAACSSIATLPSVLSHERNRLSRWSRHYALWPLSGRDRGHGRSCEHCRDLRGGANQLPPRGAAMPQRLVAGGAQLRPCSQAVPISKRSGRRCSPSATTNICGGRSPS